RLPAYRLECGGPLVFGRTAQLLQESRRVRLVRRSRLGRFIDKLVEAAVSENCQHVPATGVAAVAVSGVEAHACGVAVLPADRLDCRLRNIGVANVGRIADIGMQCSQKVSPEVVWIDIDACFPPLELSTQSPGPTTCQHHRKANGQQDAE